MINEEKNNKKLGKILILSIGILVFLVGVTYAMYKITLEGQRTHTINTNRITFTYEEPTNELSITTPEGMSDVNGMAQENYFEFNVKASSTKEETIPYYIYLTQIATENDIPQENVKVYLTSVDNNIETQAVVPTLVSDLDSTELLTSKIIYNSSFIFDGTSSAEVTHKYRLRTWLNEGFNIRDLTTITQTGNGEQNVTLEEYGFKFKVNVNTINTLPPSNFDYDSTTETYIKTFNYTGGVQELPITTTGYYQIELWGAQGGNASSTYTGGKGGYTNGTIYFKKDEQLYIYVGGIGIQGLSTSVSGGYNGGGATCPYTGDNANNMGSGGGATDIRCFYNSITAKCESNTSNLTWNDATGLNSRIMVAGGGGGAYYHTAGANYSSYGGVGGNLIGGDGTVASASYVNGKGGTQISGGTAGTSGAAGGFGLGGVSSSYSSGGGSGYYGGGNAHHSGSGGGSSFISGHLGCIAIAKQTTPGNPRSPRNGSDTVTQCTATSAASDVECSKHYSNKVFFTTTTEMKSGNETMPTRDKTSTMTGNANKGYARITWIGSVLP